MAINYKKIGERIQKLRKQRGLSVATLANMIYFTPKSIILAEDGQTTLGADFLVALCTALNVTPNDLLAGEYTVTGEAPMPVRESPENEGPTGKGAVIKDTESAVEDIRKMVVKMKQEAKTNANKTQSSYTGKGGFARFSQHD